MKKMHIMKELIKNELKMNKIIKIVIGGKGGTTSFSCILHKDSYLVIWFGILDQSMNVWTVEEKNKNEWMNEMIKGWIKKGWMKGSNKRWMN